MGTVAVAGIAPQVKGAENTAASKDVTRKLARYVVAAKYEDLPASATVRSFASVTRRAQPGVGMVAPAPVIKTTVTKKVRTTSTSTGQNDVATR